MTSWIPCDRQSPPQGVIVDTCIDDGRGFRNHQKLMLIENLWWHPDGVMYVYYNPTHWRPLP